MPPLSFPRAIYSVTQIVTALTCEERGRRENHRRTNEMGKSKKGDKLSAGEKRALFWAAVISQKAKDLRASLTNTGIEAQTRDEEGYTSIQLACVNNKPSSLDMLLDWYKRRRVLRQKGWVNLRDDDGRTALMLACERGYEKCIETLIDSEVGCDVDAKDFRGFTARDYAAKSKKKNMLKFYDELLNPPSSSEEEVLDGEGIVDTALSEMTSTQRSKLKKKRLQQLERGRGGQTNLTSSNKKKEKVVVDMKLMPTPRWIEVQKVIESIENLRELKELSVMREEEESGKHQEVIDPALWYMTGINRLEIRMGKDVLTKLPSDRIHWLSSLHTLILNHNSLTEIPEEIGQLEELKSLELSYNKLKTLPKCIGALPNLELLNLECNELDNLQFIHSVGLEPGAVSKLTTLNVSTNQIKVLDIDFERKPRLRVISATNNQIEEISNRIVFLEQLNELVLEKNMIRAVPTEICQLKKVKVLKMNDNPIKDQKVVKMLKQTGKLKELWKYFKKNGGEAVQVERVDYESLSQAIAEGEVEGEEVTTDIPGGELTGDNTTQAVEEDGDEEDSSDWDSDCSFDITYEEL